MSLLQFPSTSVRALNGWVTRRTHDLHNALGGRWIVWCPSHPYPPTKRWRSRRQAKAIAHKMSEKQFQMFIVCELQDIIGVEYATSSYATSSYGHSRRAQC